MVKKNNSPFKQTFKPMTKKQINKAAKKVNSRSQMELPELKQNVAEETGGERL
jgi:hypothetical protein